MRRLLIAALLLVGLAPLASATWFYGEESGGGGGSAPSLVDSWTWAEATDEVEPYSLHSAYTAGSGSNRVLVLAVGIEDWTGNCHLPSGATYGSESMTLLRVDNQNNGADIGHALFVLKEADIPSGSNAVTVTTTGTSCDADIGGWIATLQDVEQTTTEDTGCTNASGVASTTIACSASISPSANTLTIALAGWDDAQTPPGNISWSSQLTIAAEEDPSGTHQMGLATGTSTDTYTPTGTNDQSSDNTVIVVTVLNGAS